MAKDIEKKVKEMINEFNKEKPETRITVLEGLVKIYASVCDETLDIFKSSIKLNESERKKVSELESTIESLTIKHIKTTTDLEKFLKNFKWVVVSFLILILREHILRLAIWLNEIISQITNWISHRWSVMPDSLQGFLLERLWELAIFVLGSLVALIISPIILPRLKTAFSRTPRPKDRK